MPANTSTDRAKGLLTSTLDLLSKNARNLNQVEALLDALQLFKEDRHFHVAPMDGAFMGFRRFEPKLSNPHKVVFPDRTCQVPSDFWASTYERVITALGGEDHGLRLGIARDQQRLSEKFGLPAGQIIPVILPSVVSQIPEGFSSEEERYRLATVAAMELLAERCEEGKYEFYALDALKTFYERERWSPSPAYSEWLSSMKGEMHAVYLAMPFQGFSVRAMHWELEHGRLKRFSKDITPVGSYVVAHMAAQHPALIKGYPRLSLSMAGETFSSYARMATYRLQSDSVKLMAQFIGLDEPRYDTSPVVALR